MSTNPEELHSEELRPEELPEELRDLRLGRPRPTLRQDTLRALRRALDEPAPGAPRAQRWWDPWRVELSFAAAITVACCLLNFCLLSPECQLPETLRPTPSPVALTSTPVAAELEELGPYATWYRAAVARRHSERRHDHAVITHSDLDRI